MRRATLRGALRFSGGTSSKAADEAKREVVLLASQLVIERERREEEDVGEELGREGEKAVVTAKVITTAAAWIFIVLMTGRSDGDGEGKVRDCRY
mmetsp:Transcript_12054/g.21753  ORF Transcript_12054/g.21753 Transcript_12054/m.21753 type:complete len:95 (+) Transcript_12054:2503-2787(+)